MAATGGETDLGTTLRLLMKERALSMRKLASLTGIDTATISRIANGKQQARPEHLRQFALRLGVPLERLWQAAGYDVGGGGNAGSEGGSAGETGSSGGSSGGSGAGGNGNGSGTRESMPGAPPSSWHESVDSIQRVLLTSNFIDPQFTAEHVRKELVKYEQYALTEEGERTIREGFRSKIDSVGGAGPFIEQLRGLYELFGRESTPPLKRAIAGSALLYFILSADIIPDYAFPFGYLDDAIAVQLTLDRLAEITE